MLGIEHDAFPVSRDQTDTEAELFCTAAKQVGLHGLPRRYGEPLSLPRPYVFPAHCRDALHAFPLSITLRVRRRFSIAPSN
ncbi:hypothetical protein [Paraburkholderia aromaticivorans]|uniref:hypothetical protein n=1 Tax=Paraburkholderia aromaticivorans TaxID=2026199 RepID=UPI00145603F1|nr:hypothetical protein [Paraburkholderia aromaticivorans]